MTHGFIINRCLSPWGGRNWATEKS